MKLGVGIQTRLKGLEKKTHTKTLHLLFAKIDVIAQHRRRRFNEKAMMNLDKQAKK